MTSESSVAIITLNDLLKEMFRVLDSLTNHDAIKECVHPKSKEIFILLPFISMVPSSFPRRPRPPPQHTISPFPYLQDVQGRVGFVG